MQRYGVICKNCRRRLARPNFRKCKAGGHCAWLPHEDLAQLLTRDAQRLTERAVREGLFDEVVAARARVLGWLPPPSEEELEELARALEGGAAG